MADQLEQHTGKCHCGAVHFEVQLPNGIENVRRCNCSLCRRKGAVVAGVVLDNLRITRGADNLALYTWNTGVAKHYFCKTCGIYTHHQRRSNPEQYGFNLGCLEGFELEQYRDVPIGDGRSMSLVDD